MAKKKGVTTNLAGKSAKHKNHTVPKGLLKQWLTKKDEQEGYWVLDCNSGNVQFRKGDGASFAIKEFRYVPVRYTPQGTAYRDEWLEDWFSQGESDLVVVTKQLSSGQFAAVKDKARDNFITAAIMLGFRSAYEFDCMEMKLRRENPDSSDEVIGRWVVDHFRSLHAAKLEQFKNWDFALHSGMAERLLIGDRPLFDMTMSDRQFQTVVIPLTPDHFLSGCPPENPAQITWQLKCGRAAGGAAIGLNSMTAKLARQFVVGEHQQLLALSDLFTQQQFTERKAKDVFLEFSKEKHVARTPVNE